MALPSLDRLMAGYLSFVIKIPYVKTIFYQPQNLHVNFFEPHSYRALYIAFIFLIF